MIDLSYESFLAWLQKNKSNQVVSPDAGEAYLTFVGEQDAIEAEYSNEGEISYRTWDPMKQTETAHTDRLDKRINRYLEIWDLRTAEDVFQRDVADLTGEEILYWIDNTDV